MWYTDIVCNPSRWVLPNIFFIYEVMDLREVCSFPGGHTIVVRAGISIQVFTILKSESAPWQAPQCLIEAWILIELAGVNISCVTNFYESAPATTLPVGHHKYIQIIEAKESLYNLSAIFLYFNSTGEWVNFHQIILSYIFILWYILQ